MIVTKIEVLWFEKKMYHCLAYFVYPETVRNKDGTEQHGKKDIT